MAEQTSGLPLAEALARLLQRFPGPLQSLGVERLPLPRALERVLAEPLLAPAAVPGFRAAVMDGYALRSADLAQHPRRQLPLLGCSTAGTPWPRPLERPGVVRIMTGAAVPEGADAVVPQELVTCHSLSDGSAAVVIEAAVRAGQWIRPIGEEATAGALLQKVGSLLGPVEIARAIGCGLREAVVQRRPRVALLISGSELRPAGEPLGPGQIHDSNGPLLAALLQRLGVALVERRWVDDDPTRLEQALLAMARRCDVLISTGGVSVGEGDHVRPLLERLGRLEFWRVLLKPGRPFACGELAGVAFFGLPGNPVSATVTFLQLVWPVLQQLEGREPRAWPRLRVRLREPLQRRAGRPELLRAQLESDGAGNAWARVCGAQGSARLGSLLGADLLLELNADTTSLPAGAAVMAQLLRQSLL